MTPSSLSTGQLPLFIMIFYSSLLIFVCLLYRHTTTYRHKLALVRYAVYANAYGYIGTIDQGPESSFFSFSYFYKFNRLIFTNS